MEPVAESPPFRHADESRPQELLAVFAVPEDELTRLRALSPMEAEQAASDAQNDADDLFKALDTDTRDRELTLQARAVRQQPREGILH